MQYGSNLALKKEKELKTMLMKEKKLILILDLDNTVLHSRTINGFVHSPTYNGRIYKNLDLFQIPLSGKPDGPCTHTKFRPFVKEFIQMIQPYFKIYIYTMGTRLYATNVMRFLQREVPDFEISENKIISRDDGHDHTEGKIYKTLRQLSPTDQSFYIILDDRGDVWPEAGPNLLQVYPYIYFPNSKEESVLKIYPDYFQYFTKNEVDPFLLYYGVYLKKLHDIYYKKVEENTLADEGVDLRNVLADDMSQLFSKIY